MPNNRQLGALNATSHSTENLPTESCVTQRQSRKYRPGTSNTRNPCVITINEDKDIEVVDLEKSSTVEES